MVKSLWNLWHGKLFDECVCIYDVGHCSSRVDILALSGWPALAFIITTGDYGYGNYCEWLLFHVHWYNEPDG